MYLKHFKGYCIRLDTTTLLMEDVDTISDEFRVDVVRSKSNPVLEKRIVFKVYKRRWFILFVLCLLNCSNSILWLTFAPVVDHSAQFLGVTLDQINWLSIIYMVLVLGSWLNTLGAVLRFVGILRSLPNAANFPVVMGGQTLCALAQPLVIFTPTKLAALWFPEHQRATANMIASMSNPLGILIASIFSPMIVGTTNNIPLLWGSVIVPPPPPQRPPQPVPKAPTQSLEGIKLLLRNKAYMIILILLLRLGDHCVHLLLYTTGADYVCPTNFAGLCGGLFIVFGIVGAGFLGLYVDKTKKFTKVNRSLSALACIAFSGGESGSNLRVSQMRNQGIAVAVACSLCGFFGFSIYPVAMELSVECSYPVGEATSAGLIFISGQIQSVIYILLLQGLTKQMADSPFSTCSVGGSTGDWTLRHRLVQIKLTLTSCDNTPNSNQKEEQARG
ncbi:unnamed protein product [Coregonus sp. 'balchen']|nr:unnamed protein product [Coregonus sp. 'balchen']